MSYLVLARKYRPETFVKVVGQEPIARTLQNALKTGRLAHAYLFTGPRGVGKTSMARILAKALLCERAPTPDPCLTCERCRGVAAGNVLDVIEIDGASNRGIENIRDLRESVRYAATAGKYKVYIVDEVHQITQDAFNAFLKTLEEPPPNVVFVFATTEVRKVPETIRSRCQEFEFRRIPDAAIAGHVRDVCAGESFTLAAGLDAAIARRARGGLRDALSLLDQLAAFGAGAISHEAFQELTGYLAPERVRQLFDALLARDGSAVFSWLADALGHGAAAADLLDQWLDHLRALVHHRVGSPRPPDLAGVGADALAAQAKALDETQLLGAMQVLLDARRALRDIEDERLVLEMALVELLRIRDLELLRDALAGAAAPARPPAGPPQRAVIAPPSPAPPPVTTPPVAPSAPRAATPAAARPPSPPPPPPPTAPPAGSGGGGDLPARFERLRAALLAEAPSLAALVAPLEPVRDDGGVVQVRARSGPGLPATPNARLDEATRRLGKKLFDVSWTLRPETVAAAPTGGGDTPAQALLVQVKQIFGGETVSGQEAQG
ncbi:MAG: DNA polymerase III subunit gamma/tau [Planctomycetes bacterium]|nr:DNA polymerase III subunit gamma/tau [Planctomycetota bacterium]